MLATGKRIFREGLIGNMLDLRFSKITVEKIFPTTLKN
jgi:hypothetical protein